MDKKTAIVITTINIPGILEGISKNMIKYGHMKDTGIIIIGDKKTPEGIVEYCNEIQDKYKIDIDYLGIEEQEEAFKAHPKLLKLFPYNHPDRTILGHILAYQRGYERTIALDDDNFPTDCDFIGSHNITGKTASTILFKNDLGWFNVHSTLNEKNNIPFYPRGYPWGKRVEEANEKVEISAERKVVVNQGLVLEDPDVDAITRLFYPIRATSMKDEFPKQFGLYPGTWSPFNFQNTCLSRELVPLYYRPLSTQRNADIWTAYLFNKLAEHFGDVITFGNPLCKQIRNEHDLWEDLDVELVCNKATDAFVDILRTLKIEGDTYFDALGNLLETFIIMIPNLEIKTPEGKMIIDYFKEYKIWYDIISEVINEKV